MQLMMLSGLAIRTYGAQLRNNPTIGLRGATSKSTDQLRLHFDSTSPWCRGYSMAKLPELYERHSMCIIFGLKADMPLKPKVRLCLTDSWPCRKTPSHNRYGRPDLG